jgi:hypothetical protein
VLVVKIQRSWLRMTYRCCGMEWTDEWPEAFKLECPDCSVLVEASTIVEIEARPTAAKRAVQQAASAQPARAQRV